MDTPADTASRARRRKPWERAFLLALAELGTVTQAAEAAKTSRESAYKLRANAPDFADAWDDARERCFDRLERLAMERVEKGWDEPVYQGGELVGHRRMFSERLHERLLESAGRFRRNVELTGPGGKDLNLGPNVLVIRRVVKAEPAPSPATRVPVHGNGNGRH